MSDSTVHRSPVMTSVCLWSRCREGHSTEKTGKDPFEVASRKNFKIHFEAYNIFSLILLFNLSSLFIFAYGNIQG